MTTTIGLATKLGALVLGFSAFAACSTAPSAQETASGSTLTAVNITLPAKSKLPASLANKKDLSYCFAIASNDGVAYDGKTDALNNVSCEALGPHYSADKQQFGVYAENVTINAKLPRDKHHTLILKILGKEDASTPVAVALVPTTTVFYAAHSRVQPSEMTSKDKIQVVMKLEKLFDDGDLPDVIPTAAGDVDVDVKVELPEAEGEGKIPGKDDCVVPAGVALTPC